MARCRARRCRCDRAGAALTAIEWTRRSRFVLAAAAVYGTTLAAIALWPTHVDRGFNVFDTPPGRFLLAHGLTYDQTYSIIEFSANVLMFVPFGVLAMVAWSRMTWIRTVLLAIAVSGGIELVQAVARPGRTADGRDVLANVTGAAVGAGLVVVWRRVRR